MNTILHIGTTDSLKSFKDWFISPFGSEWHRMNKKQKQEAWSSAMHLRQVTGRKIYANPYKLR